MRTVHGILFVSLFLAPPLFSQLPATSCGPNEVLEECYGRLQGEAAVAEREEAVAAEAERAPAVGQPLTKEAAEERVTTSATPGVATSVLDLLPSFLAAAGIQGFGETEDSYTFDNLFGLGEGLRLDLGAVVYRDPEIFEPLRSELPEDVKDQVLSDLREQVGDFDKTDVKILLSWEKGTGAFRFGRDPDDYWDVVGSWYSGYYLSLLGEIESTSLEDWIFSDEVEAAEKVFGEDFLSKTPAELRALPNATNDGVDRLVNGLVKAATGMGELQRATREAMAGLAKQVGELITNQPQILFEGVYRERDHLTGPSEWSARFRYEVALSGNVNDFLTWAERKASDSSTGCSAEDAPAYSYGCYQAWRKSASAVGMKEATATDRGNRLAIEVQYTGTDPLRFELPGEDSPEPAFRFALERTQKWTGSLTYGINLEGVQLPNLLGALGGGSSIVPVDTARFDLEAKYDDVTGDPMRQSRFTATATLSQKMSNNTVMSLAAVWANKPEYLGEVGEELSANLGLKWKLGRKQDDGGAGAPGTVGGE